jgi:2-octaprenyl-6-methoxyphenol hydroxylase
VSGTLAQGDAAAAPLHDVAVIGGGPVGCACALALRAAGLSVLLLEAGQGRSGDRRSIALSHGSRLILERLGAWNALTAAAPIESIHVSQQGGFGRALLTACEAGLPALGYVVPYAGLYAALSQRLADSADVQLRRGTEALEAEDVQDGVRIACRTDGSAWQARARVAVLADGGGLARTAATQRERDYAQCAVVADVQSDHAPGSRAYERFTPRGPIALLPSHAGFALVWTTTPDEAQGLSALADADFLLALQRAFGERAGRFTGCSGRATYPLALRVAGAPRSQRMVLLGNAAQTLHPVAGQGLNLGLRDAWQLARLAREDPGALGSRAFVQRFSGARRADRAGTIALTDGLVTAFSNDIAPVRWLRGAGLTLLDIVPPVKGVFVARMTFGG